MYIYRSKIWNLPFEYLKCIKNIYTCMPYMHIHTCTHQLASHRSKWYNCIWRFHVYYAVVTYHLCLLLLVRLLFCISTLSSAAATPLSTLWNTCLLCMHFCCCNLCDILKQIVKFFFLFFVVVVKTTSPQCSLVVEKPMSNKQKLLISRFRRTVFILALVP